MFNLTMLGHADPFKGNKKCVKGEDTLTINNNNNNKYNENLKLFNKYSNSNLKYNQLKTKHVRHPKEPNQIYTRPMTSSNQIGWWTKDAPIDQNLKWTKVERRVFPKSEMTS
jgi:hypothetical protein